MSSKQLTMAFVPNYQYDAFVSYAHVDDRPLVGVDEGWVSTLIENLEIILAQKVGRREGFNIWHDDHLVKHKALTPEILNAVQNSATFILILSPGYIASKWCLREKETFIQNQFLREIGKKDSRIFIVARDEVDRLKQPEEFRDLLGYRFYIKDKNDGPTRILGALPKDLVDQPYHDVLNDLAHELYQEWVELKGKEMPGGNGSEEDQPVVFLAQGTADLRKQREEVQRYLKQEHIRVLPDKWISPDPVHFQEVIKQNLDRSDVFVQLISEFSQEPPPALPQGYAVAQYEIATRSELPVLQWRRPDLDLASVDDPAHLDLLQMSSVMAVSMEAFKQEVVKTVKSRKEVNGTAKDQNVFVFVNSEMSDVRIAEEVCDRLAEYGIGFSMRLNEGSPKELREDFEENLRDCDKLIIIYGEITPAWVRHQLAYVRRVNPKRRKPLQSLAVYEGPPDPKDPLHYQLPSMQTLDCRNGLNEAELKKFILGVKSNGA